jgi:poly-gamma-glutamate synthesis protein (capsule biosynthesis protein)
MLEKPGHPYKLILFILVGTLLTGCSTPAPQIERTARPTATVVSQTEEPVRVPTPTLTATDTPFTLFLDGSLPDDLFSQALPGKITIADTIPASAWLGPAEIAPEGEIAFTATRVYALAAPFPTLMDDVSLNVLRVFWRGHTIKPLSTVNKLYVPENIAPILDLRWGKHSPKTIHTYQSPPAADTLWEENSWAILPFDSLDPQLKVISIDGASPLHKDFSPDGSPLVFHYQLISIPATSQPSHAEDLQSISAAIQPTNRDPGKMTTLIMTGVTALVRATAAKMEEKGVLYPGQEIAEWLMAADLTHISNEVSFYDACPPPDPHNRMLLFCSDPKYIELFASVGADIIELTGNHNNDSLYVYGEDVVPFTLDLYDQYGMQYFGGGRNLEEARTPLVITHNGNKIAFLGCNAPGPDFAWATEEQGGAAPCGDYQWMVDQIAQLRQQGILPIATFQYYEDYYNFPESHHIRDFGRIAEAGAVIVNGSQAHRPKAMAFESDTYIDYGLGNLFFDQMGIIDAYGVQILQTRWEKIQRHTFYDGKHLSTELLTAILEDYAQPRPMTAEERLIFLEEIFAASGWESR